MRGRQQRPARARSRRRTSGTRSGTRGSPPTKAATGESTAGRAVPRPRLETTRRPVWVALAPDNRSVREPHLLAELNEEGELRDLVVSFARELVSNPSVRDLFGIQIVRPARSPSTALALPGTPTVSPDDIPECVSLRDSALIPVDPEAPGRVLAAVHLRRRAGAAARFTRFGFRARSKSFAKAGGRCGAWSWWRASLGRLRRLGFVRPSR